MPDEPSPASAPGADGVPVVGQIVGGKFIVEGVLGEGGMGVVLAARHLQLGQRVAIKVLKPEAVGNAEAVGRFLREARAAVQLTSAHVVRVMDVGTLPEGLPYMVMEHLTGTDLNELLDQRGTLAVGDTVDYVLQAMEAVAEAHALGLVHRDLKPANLFLARRPDGSALVKVLDFGISKALQPSPNDQSLTSTITVMGSPMYMSPEQLRSAKNVDARTDLWALGVVLYQLVSARYPFEDETATGLAARIAADPPVPLHQHRGDVPRAFEAVVMRCLEKDVRARWQTVGDLAAALRPFASAEGQLAVDRIVRISVARESGVPPESLVQGRGTLARISNPSHRASGFADTVGKSSWDTGSPPVRRRGVFVVLAGCAALLAAVAGLVLAFHGQGAPAPSIVAASGAGAASTASPPAVDSPDAASPSVAMAPSTPPPMPPAASTPARTAWTPAHAPTRPGPAATKPPAAAPTELVLDRK